MICLHSSAHAHKWASLKSYVHDIHIDVKRIIMCATILAGRGVGMPVWVVQPTEQALSAGRPCLAVLARVRNLTSKLLLLAVYLQGSLVTATSRHQIILLFYHFLLGPPTIKVKPYVIGVAVTLAVQVVLRLS